MTSHLTKEFRELFDRLPNRVKRVARKNYRVWKQNPNHPGIDFKKVARRLPIYSVRIGIGWRALGIVEKDIIVRFWIGSHAEYDLMLKKM